MTTAIDLDPTPEHWRELCLYGETIRTLPQQEAMELWKTAGCCKCQKPHGSAADVDLRTHFRNGRPIILESHQGVVSEVVRDDVEITYETMAGPIKQIYHREQFVGTVPKEGDHVEPKAKSGFAGAHG